MANTYNYGDTVRITGTVTNAAGTPTDPAEVFFEYIPPGAAKVPLEFGIDPELIKDETGIYYVDIDASTAGVWHYRFYSTGSGQGAGEHYFKVNPSEFD